MASPRNTLASAERAIEAALNLCDQHQQNLCAIVESEQATPDEKYQALVSLANLTGILVGQAAEAEAGKRSN
jgi:hypothetical protein